MKSSLRIALLLMPLSACSLFPQSAPALPDGTARQPVNNPAAIAEFMRLHDAMPVAAAPLYNEAAQDRIDITLAQMLEQYIPADYQVFPGAGIRLDRKINYDRSRAWRNSIPAALAATDMSVSIDPVRHAVFINAR